MDARAPSVIRDLIKNVHAQPLSRSVKIHAMCTSSKNDGVISHTNFIINIFPPSKTPHAIIKNIVISATVYISSRPPSPIKIVVRRQSGSHTTEYDIPTSLAHTTDVSNIDRTLLNLPLDDPFSDAAAALTPIIFSWLADAVPGAPYTEFTLDAE